jgi:CRISPR-associated protein Cas2
MAAGTEVRFVWLFVFFDLPVGTKPERRDANRFRNFLKDDGYMMLQFSVYARVCRGEDGAMKHIARVTRNLPGKSSVRALQVTDRQYERMRLLLGQATKTESTGARQMVLL